MQKAWLPYFLLRRFMLFNCFFFKEALGLCSGSIKKCLSTVGCWFEYLDWKK